MLDQRCACRLIMSARRHRGITGALWAREQDMAAAELRYRGLEFRLGPLPTTAGSGGVEIGRPAVHIARNTLQLTQRRRKIPVALQVEKESLLLPLVFPH